MVKKLCFALFTSLLCVTHLLGQEVGNATFYGKRFEGRRTSDGSIYHRDSMTCAHRTYPFGTRLLVRNPRNGQEVIVKVTDRGPFGKRLMIDLSYRAAQTLGIVRMGVAQVEVTPYETLVVPYRPAPLRLARFMDAFPLPPIDYTPKKYQKLS